MGRLLLWAGVLALFFLAFSAEAARRHENFSQGKYYDHTQPDSETPIRVETEDTPSKDNETKEGTDGTPIDKTEKPQPAPVDSTIPDRYPHGYPGQEQYNMQLNTDTDPESRYTTYKNNNVQFNSVNTDGADVPQTIPDRYPTGYPGFENPLYSSETDPEAKFQQSRYGSFATQPDPTDVNTEIPNRYPNGYYGDADIEARTQGEADVYTQHPTDKHVSYSTFVDNPSTDGQTQTFHDRYPSGYYPGLNGNPDGLTDTQVNKRQQNQVSYSQYNQPRYGYEGIQGDFSTQLQGSEIPFELTGGACPSQYWVSNPQKWPKFFSINSKVIDAFGGKASKVYGETTLLDALTDTRAEPYSRLVNAACTAILNSYSRAQYEYKHPAVIEAFIEALASPDAALKQALVFEKSNVSVFSAGIGGSCT